MVNTELAHIIGDQEQLEMCMPVTRLRHQNVGKLVENADRFLRLHIAATFVTLNLYFLGPGWRLGVEPIFFTIGLTWTLLSLSYLGIVCVGAAMVNSQVFIIISSIIIYHFIDYFIIMLHNSSK